MRFLKLKRDLKKKISDMSLTICIVYVNYIQFILTVIITTYWFGNIFFSFFSVEYLGFLNISYRAHIEWINPKTIQTITYSIYKKELTSMSNLLKLTLSQK